MKRFPEDVRRVVAGLRRELHRAGRGAVLRTVRALGLRRTYFYEWSTRPPESLDVGRVFAILRALGVDEGAFFLELGAGDRRGEIWEGPEPIEERATPATRRAVAIVYRRMRDDFGLAVDAGDVVEAASFTDPSSRHCPAGGSVEVSAENGPSLGAGWLEDLDGRRQTEPEAVIRELADGLHQVEAAHLPRALGVWGSALWVQIELEAAAYVNRRALRLAAAAGDEATVADLLLRRSNVVADAGDHAGALVLADLSAAIAERIGDRTGDWTSRGRAAVDQGRLLYYLERPRESIAALERALELVPESLPRSRAAAYSGICLCGLQLGELSRAQDLAEEAERLPVGPWERGKLAWIRAGICRELGDRSGAVAHLRRAAETFCDLNHGEALLISLELVQALLEDGDTREARQVCRTMHRLTEPLRRNPIISGALAEVLRLAVSGEELPLRLVKRIRATIERERSRKGAKARRAWRALAVGSAVRVQERPQL